MIEGEQIEEVLDRVEHVPDDYDGDVRNEPLVPFTGDLVLNREAEDRLMEHCTGRIKQLEEEMGRTMVQNTGWWLEGGESQKAAESWMGKRERYEATFHNNLEWRSHVLGDKKNNIFAHSNLTVPLSRRIARQMVARANNYFFATDPWFSAQAERGSGDDELAEKIDHYAKYKLREAKSKSSKEKAVELAFVRGECVLKSTYTRKVDWYETTAEVLVDIEGEPILTSDGDYIFKNDRWGPEVLVDETTGAEEVMPGSDVLERDPTVRKPDDLLWQSMRIRRQVEQFEGAECKPVYYKDFLCPLTAETVQDADFVAHLYDMPLMELAEQYRKRNVLADKEEDASKEGGEWKETLKAVALLRELADGDGSPKAAANRKEENALYEPETLIGAGDGVKRGDTVRELAECMLYFDANMDGIREHIFVVLDRDSGRPVYYDYMANMTPDGRRPFDVIRPSAVDGRWYGSGAMELFDETQQIVDLLINRWNFANSGAGRVTFWNPSLTVEGDRNPNLKLNDGGTYTPKPGVEIENILTYVELPNVKHEQLKDMFEFFLQAAMNESGVQHANDANMVGLDQAKLATGIRNIEKSGMEMFGAYISALEPGIQDCLTREINLLFANLDKEEWFEYYAREEADSGEGAASVEPAVARVSLITPEEVRDLTIRVNVLLTRYKGEQMMEQSSTGWRIVQEYYSQDPAIQARTAHFVRMMLKSLDLGVNAEATIQPVELQDPSGQGAVNDAAAAHAARTGPDNTPEPNL